MCITWGWVKNTTVLILILENPAVDLDKSACLASEWGDGYVERVLNFMDATGMDIIETDGPYHGDVCASTTHKHHNGLADSQLRQWEACVNFYHECRKRGIYINSPDWYYLNGSNKCGMGYRENELQFAPRTTNSNSKAKYLRCDIPKDT